MRRIRYWARLALVLTIVFMLTINTANACRLFHWRYARHQVCAPVVYVSPVCAGEVIVHERVVIPKDRPAVKSPRDQKVDAASMEEETAESSPVDVAPPEPDLERMPEPAAEPDGADDLFAPTPSADLDPVPVAPVEDLEPPMDLPDDAGDLFDEPAPAGDDTGDLFIEPAPAGDDEPDLFDEPAPAGDDAGDLFDEPAPAGDDAGDLFNEPAPAGDNAGDLFNDPAPAGDDAGDLFNEPAPAGDDAGDLFNDPAPAGDDAGDLFNDPAPAGDDAGDLFNDPAPAGDDAGDLFNDPAPAGDDAGDLFNDPAPAGDDAGDLFNDPAPAGDDAGDLFNDPAPAGDDAGDLFNDPAPAGDDAGDLFNDPAPADDNAKNLMESADRVARDVSGSGNPAALKRTSDDKSVRDADSIKVSKTSLSEKAAQARSGKGMRVWTDDTGRHHTTGRLVLISRSHVRLLKDNGRYSTVPISRLSSQDLGYVLAIAKKLTRGTEQIASR